MIICTALYYTGSLERGDLIVRDNRFYPGKYVETLSVWWQYVQKHYSDVPVVFLCDAGSPIPVLTALEKTLNGIPYSVFSDSWPPIGTLGAPRVFVKMMTEHCGKYFWPMQRNLVEAIKIAHNTKNDLFWLDSDAFLNTDIRPLIRGYDVAAPSIANHQQTMDSVCTYISSRRLRELKRFDIDMSSFLSHILKDAPNETRMHLLQEGGLYKLFAYGRVKSIGRSIELSHLSCYRHFMAFLHRNPIDSLEYESLRFMLSNLDMNRLNGVELEFYDMDCRKDGSGNYP